MEQYITGVILSRGQILNFVHQLLKGLVFLHQRNIIHTDIKPANVLVYEPKSASTRTLKISDYDHPLHLKGPLTRTSEVQHLRGTPWYMSPETVRIDIDPSTGKPSKPGRKSDIWSLGCLILDMVVGSGNRLHHNPATGAILRKCESDFAEFIRFTNNGGVPLIPENLEHDFRAHLNSYLLHDQNARKSAAELLSDPILGNGGICGQSSSSLSFKVDGVEHDYSITKFIGNGKDSIVYLVKENGELPNEFAVKQFTVRTKSKNAVLQRSFIDDLLPLKRLVHENVANYLAFSAFDMGDVLIGTTIVSILMEYCEDLGRTCIYSSKQHRSDLKPKNILITSSSQKSRTILKIANCEGHMGHLLLTEGYMGYGNSNVDSSYWSPELFEAVNNSQSTGISVGPKTDVWSFACVVLEMLQGLGSSVSMPQGSGTGNPTTDLSLISGPEYRFPTIPDNIDSDFRGFLEKLLQREQSQRPTSAQALADPFLLIRELVQTPLQSTVIDALTEPLCKVSLLNRVCISVDSLCDSVFALKDSVAAMRVVLQKIKDMDVAAPVSITCCGNGEWADIFQLISKQIVSIEFDAAHGWNSGSLRGQLLPNLLHLEFNSSRDIELHNSDLSIYPNLRAVIFTDSSFARIENNFLHQIPNLRHIGFSELVDFRNHRIGLPQLQNYVRIMESNEFSWLAEFITQTQSLVTPKQDGELWSIGAERSAPKVAGLLKPNDAFVAQMTQYCETLPRFRMGMYTTDKISKDLNEHFLNLTRVDGMWQLSRHGLFFDITLKDSWVVSFASPSGQTQKEEVQKLFDLLNNWNLDHPLKVCVFGPISFEAVELLHLADRNRNIVYLHLEDFVYGTPNLRKLELPNLLVLELVNYGNCVIGTGDLNGFPQLRQFRVLDGTENDEMMPLVENGSFEMNTFLRNVCFSSVDAGGTQFIDATVVFAKTENAWMKEYLQQRPELLQERGVGEIFHFHGNGFQWNSMHVPETKIEA